MDYEHFRNCASMDDITLVGPPSVCKAAFDVLQEELLRLSLVVNAKKTIAIDAPYPRLIYEILRCYTRCPQILHRFYSVKTEDIV